MSIVLEQNHGGLFGSEMRSLLTSNSWRRADLVVQDAYGRTITVPKHSRINEAITEIAEQNGWFKSPIEGFRPSSKSQKPQDLALEEPMGYAPGDYLELFEKKHLYLGKLAEQIKARGISNTFSRYNGAKEWDGFILTFPKDFDATKAADIANIITEELREPGPIKTYGLDGSLNMDEDGVRGKRVVIYTTGHDNTGNLHYDFLVSRHAYDPINKEASKAVLLSDATVQASQLTCIKDALTKAGYANEADALIHKVTVSKAPVLQAQSDEVQAEVSKIKEEQGLAKPAPQAPVAGEAFVAATPTIQDLDRGLQQLTKEQSADERAMSEIVARMQARNSQMSTIEEAKAVLTEREQLLNRTMDAEVTAKEYQEKNTSLQAENTAVKTEINEFKTKLVEAMGGEAEIDPEATLNNVVDTFITNLADVENVLESEKAEHEGTKTTLNTTKETLKKTEETLKNTEAVVTTTKDQLAKAVEDANLDPEAPLDKVVEAVLTKVGAQETQLAKLTADLQKLQEQFQAKVEEAERLTKAERTISNLVAKATGENAYASLGAEEAANKLVVQYSKVLGDKVEAEEARNALKGQVTALENTVKTVQEDLNRERSYINTLREGHDKEVRELKAEHKTEMEGLKAEIKADMQEWKQERESMMRQMEQMMQKQVRGNFNPTPAQGEPAAPAPQETGGFKPNATAPASDDDNLAKRLLEKADEFDKTHNKGKVKGKDDPENNK